MARGFEVGWCMRRRDLLLLGTAAITWPTMARPQTSGGIVPVIGFLGSATAAAWQGGGRPAVLASPGLERDRLHRGQERRHRVSLGRRPLRSLAGTGGGTSAKGHRGPRRACYGGRGEGRDGGN